MTAMRGHSYKGICIIHEYGNWRLSKQNAQRPNKTTHFDGLVLKFILKSVEIARLVDVDD